MNELSPLAQAIWAELEQNHGAVTRYQLRDMLHTSDRSIRAAVKELRDHGFNVVSVSDSSSKGYWIGTEEDKRRTIAELKSRAYKMLATAAALEAGPDQQIKWEDVL